MSELKEKVKKNLSLIEEIEIYKNYKINFLDSVKKAKGNKVLLKNILKGKTEKEQIDFYDNYIDQLLNQIETLNQEIIDSFDVKKNAAIDKKSKLEKETYLKELNLEKDYLKKITKTKKIKEIKIPDYTIYEASRYGKISNLFFENFTLKITKKYPKYFENIYISLRSSDIKVLSKTYVSMIFMSTLLSTIISFIFLFILFFLRGSSLTNIFIRSIGLSILIGVLTFFVFYMYPSTVVSSRRTAIKNDLPFMIIHMSAVAGSGAQPIVMFNLILSSGEYKGIESEVKKIVNYVNLFGYDLSTALKTVAITTPLKEFGELLNGIVATIESGGNLKSYLKEKADDAMLTYKLEREKYVEMLSTYSDMYTAILIAAPLLFMVTLAIINSLGGKIGGLSVQTLSTMGTYFVIPFLNAAFILFLNIVQPKT
ncbi:MAG: type II secretion system F family protein [Candidatus Woesearchaeota archaeon]|nr:type II secretion system F family protein [Candidatus Woesearchaeota archaeon]